MIYYFLVHMAYGENIYLMNLTILLLIMVIEIDIWIGILMIHSPRPKE